MKLEHEVRVVAVMRGDPDQPESIQIEGRQDGTFLKGLPKAGTKYQAAAGVLVRKLPRQVDSLKIESFANTVFADLDAVERALTKGLHTRSKPHPNPVHNWVQMDNIYIVERNLV